MKLSVSVSGSGSGSGAVWLYECDTVLFWRARVRVNSLQASPFVYKQITLSCNSMLYRTHPHPFLFPLNPFTPASLSPHPPHLHPTSLSSSPPSSSLQVSFISVLFENSWKNRNKIVFLCFWFLNFCCVGCSSGNGERGRSLRRAGWSSSGEKW